MNVLIPEMNLGKVWATSGGHGSEMCLGLPQQVSSVDNLVPVLKCSKALLYLWFYLFLSTYVSQHYSCTPFPSFHFKLTNILFMSRLIVISKVVIQIERRLGSELYQSRKKFLKKQSIPKVSFYFPSAIYERSDDTEIFLMP